MPPLNRVRKPTICVLLLACLGAVSCQATPDPFAPYLNCKFPDGLSVVETAPLAAGVTARTVQTLTGPYSVTMSAGRRIMFAYPDEDFYANVNVETLPLEGYQQSRAALIGDFEHILASGGEGTSRNYKLKPKLNGFDIQGLDRSKREGGVLGIYVFFDDPTRTVTTIYLLNQEPPKHFHNIEEYAMTRDHFINSYTACIRGQLQPH